MRKKFLIYSKEALMENIISIKNLTYFDKINKQEVFSNLSFDLSSDKIIAFLGENSNDVDSFVNIVTKKVNPNQGSVIINNFIEDDKIKQTISCTNNVFYHKRKKISYYINLFKKFFSLDVEGLLHDLKLNNLNENMKISQLNSKQIDTLEIIFNFAINAPLHILKYDFDSFNSPILFYINKKTLALKNDSTILLCSTSCKFIEKLAETYVLFKNKNIIQIGERSLIEKEYDITLSLLFEEFKHE
jgi:ABC-type multidrug transport system ATPase subunit